MKALAERARQAHDDREEMIAQKRVERVQQYDRPEVVLRVADRLDVDEREVEHLQLTSVEDWSSNWSLEVDGHRFTARLRMVRSDGQLKVAAFSLHYFPEGRTWLRGVPIARSPVKIESLADLGKALS